MNIKIDLQIKVETGRLQRLVDVDKLDRTLLPPSPPEPE